MENLTGNKYNDLTVLSFHHKQGNKTYWLCKCDCGNQKIARSDSLKNGTTKSCGCYHDKCHKTHGIWSKNPRIYKIFECMHRRCSDNKNPNYKYYGERGIKVCDEWSKDNIENFYNWAVNNGYKNNLTLDRIDCNKNYESSNCRWVTKDIQANNKRNCHYVFYKGIKATVTQWSVFLNIKATKLSYKIKKGKTLEEILQENETTISDVDLLNFATTVS